jgi:KDO2-lipid IV(A) lauroyltransferase
MADASAPVHAPGPRPALDPRAQAIAELPQSTAFDDLPLEFGGTRWPVEAPPFVEPEFDRLRHRLQYYAMRCALAGASRLPDLLRRGLIAPLASAAYRFDRYHTDAARVFLRAALPAATDAEREALVRNAWRHLFRVAVAADAVPRRVLGRRLGEVFDVHLTPEVEEVLRAPGGIVWVTAHVGFWELSPPVVAAMTGRPSYAIGKAPRNAFVAAHVQRLREAQGMRLVPRRGAMQVVPAALRAGAVVGLLLDHRPRQKPVYARYFGRPAACDRSAGVLLRRVEAPIVFYGCYGTDDPWRFDLRCTRLVRPEELAGLEPEAIATLVNGELEALALYLPDQYFWLHDRYRKAPLELPEAR